MKLQKLISVVIPCYNEQGNINLVVSELRKYLPSKYRKEIIFVDDGSSDDTRKEIKKLAKKDKSIKAIFLYRNFGHQYALFSGMKFSSGDAVISMDADLQHPPEYIPELIKQWEAGHDLVVAQKISEVHTNFIMRILRSAGYRLWAFVTSGVLAEGISDFRIANRSLIDYISKLEERRLFTRGLIVMHSRNPSSIKYHVGKRIKGESKYNFKLKNIKRTINLFTDGIISFSFLPLRIASLGGLIVILLGILFTIFSIYSKIVLKKPIIEGWTTLVSLQTISFGFIILYMGILGEYLSVIFDETKKRPRYWISETVNIKAKND